MAGDTKSHHQFAVSNNAGVVIWCLYSLWIATSNGKLSGPTIL